MIRADRLAPVLSIKKVTKAAGAGGVNTVIFSSYVTKKGDPKRAEVSRIDRSRPLPLATP